MSHLSDTPPWATNPTRRLIAEKSAAWLLYRETRSADGRHHESTLLAWQSFCYSSLSLLLISVLSHKGYEIKTSAQIKSNPKLFHLYIMHRRKGKPSIGPISLPDRRLSDYPKEIAECFASWFASVYTVALPNDAFLHQVCDSILPDIFIESSQVMETLLELDNNSSMGLDGKQPRLSKITYQQNLVSPFHFCLITDWWMTDCQKKAKRL